MPAVAGLAVAAVGAIGASIATATISSAVIGGIVAGTILTATGVAGGLLSKALTKKPKRASNASDIQSREEKQRINVTGTIEPIPVTYGYTKVGGVAYYTQAKDEYLYKAVVLSEGPISSIQQIFFDGVDSNDPKVANEYKVNLTLSWYYDEPPAPTFITFNLNPSSLLFGNQKNQAAYNALVQLQASYIVGSTVQQTLIKNSFSSFDASAFDALKPQLSLNYNSPKYRIYRSASGQNKFSLLSEVPAREFAGLTAPGTVTATLQNIDTGLYDFAINFVGYDAIERNIGTATGVNITPTGVFVQASNINLTASQQVILVNEWVRSEYRLGYDPQVPLTTFVNEAPGYDSGRKGTLLAHLGVRFKKNTEKFPQIPQISCIVLGRVIYEPRLNTTVYSNNPATCILDYLTNKLYGVGVDTSRIDYQSFIDAANYCDQLITTPAGYTVPRYSLNGTVSTSERVVDNLQSMLSSCNGRLVLVQGKFKLKIDKPETPVFTFDETNILRSGWKVSKDGIRNRKNKIQAKYINPNLNWQPDILTLTNDAYLAEDGGRELSGEIELPYTIDYYQANTLAQIYLKQTRLSMQVEFQALLKGYEVEPGDVVFINHNFTGFANKKFRVVKMTLNGDATVSVVAEEYSDAVYQTDNYDLEPSYDDINLDNPFKVQPPSNLLLSQTTNSTTLSWQVSPSAGINTYAVQYRQAGLGAWIEAGKTTEAQFGFGGISTVNPGKYDFRVKAINSIGVASEYAQTASEIVYSTATPDDVQNFKIANGLNQVTLTWDSVEQVAVGGYYKIRHIPKLTGANWTDTATFEMRIDGNRNTVTLSQIDGTYMIKAFNKFGAESVNASKIAFDFPGDFKYSLIATNQDTTFSGTKNNFSASGSVMSLTALVGGGYNNLAAYFHQNVTDLGDVYMCRISGERNIVITQQGQNWDDAPGLFDDRPGLFDDSNSGEVLVQQLFRTTRDNPFAGTPGWSDWQPLTVNDITARAIQFKLEVIKSSTDVNVTVNSLKGLVYLPERIEQRALSVPSGLTTVNFNKLFWATPELTVVINNAQSGDYVELSSQTRAAFNITVRNSSGTAVARNVSYIAKGYGEKI